MVLTSCSVGVRVTSDFFPKSKVMLAHTAVTGEGDSRLPFVRYLSYIYDDLVFGTIGKFINFGKYDYFGHHNLVKSARIHLRQDNF